MDAKYLVSGKFNCSRTKGKELLSLSGLLKIWELVMNLFDVPIKQRDKVCKSADRPEIILEKDKRARNVK